MKKPASKPDEDGEHDLPPIKNREQQDFAARISRLVEFNGGPTAFGRLIGASYTGVRNWMEGKADPGRSFLIAISRACGVTIEWLATGEGPMRIGEVPEGLVAEATDEFVYVRRYDVRASGGNGRFISEETVIGRYAYQRDWWERNIKAAPADCAIIDCDGRSMEPDINDGEPILINLKDKGLNTDAVYVFRLGERLLVKRLQLLPEGKINVISSNKADYPPYQIAQTALQSPETGSVIARVLGVPGDFRWIR